MHVRVVVNDAGSVGGGGIAFNFHVTPPLLYHG